jgi:amino acid transporter
MSGLTDSRRVFLREATGLLRNLTPLDNFILGMVGITPGVTMVLFYVYVPYLYPGVDMVMGVVGSIPIALIMGFTYWCLAASMPRSGGDYVYGSRIIHPLFGFWPNWVYTFVNVCALGFYASTVGGSYLAVMFAMLGNFFNNPMLTGWGNWAGGVNGAFVIALIAIWVSALNNILGIRAYAKAQVWMFVIAMLGIFILCGVLLFNTNQSFQTAFNSYGAAYNTSYVGIIQQAKSAGWQPQPTSFSQTVGALPYIAGFSLASVWPVLSAGEARRPGKSMFYGTVVSISVSGVIFLVSAVLFYNVVGLDFAKAWAYISNCGCTTNPLPVGPYIQYLTGILVANNPVVIFLLGFTFFVWSIILLPAFYIITTRSLFAWSFDRLLPSWIADVDDRFHVPLKAILLVAVLASLMAALSLYTTLVGYAFNLTLATVLSFSFAGMAAAYFPYSKRARHIYDSPTTPAVIKKKIAGVPLVTIVGVLEVILFLYMAYIDASSAALSGPINPASIGIIVMVFVSAVLIYYGAKIYHKRVNGIDIGMAFQELPPE